MSSRMEKYESSTAVKERTQKNRKLYEEVQDMNIDYIDINFDNAIEINPYVGERKTRSNYQKQKELDNIIGGKLEKSRTSYEPVVKEEKIYDINEILRLAKEDKLFNEDDDKKRLINTEYNILTKLNIDEIDNNDMSKENLKDLIDKIYENEKKERKKKEDLKENKDLFSDMLDSQDDQTQDKEVGLVEEVSRNILEEADDNEINIDETKEASSSIEDSSNFNFDIEKTNKTLIVVVILVIIVAIAIGYALFKYFSA